MQASPKELDQHLPKESRRFRTRLSPDELEALFERAHIPAVGRTAICRIRDSLPSRSTRTNKKSAKQRYVPLKMPFVLEAEAESTEYVALVEWDHNDTTLEIYPQPEALRLSYRSADNARSISTYTKADYFRIDKTEFVFVECKTEEELCQLQVDAPYRYERVSGGGWRSPPGELAAAELGCKFEVRSSASNNWTLHENVELLKDYYYGDDTPVPDDMRQRIEDAFSRQAWQSLYDLIHGEPGVTADVIYALLASGQVYFPIWEQRLTDQEHALIFRDELTYRSYSTFLRSRSPFVGASLHGLKFEPGATFTWDGQPWRIINPGVKKLYVQCLVEQDSHVTAELEPNEVLALIDNERIVLHVDSQSGQEFAADGLQTASKDDMQDALWRYEIINGTPSKDNKLVGVVRRTVFYWKRAYADAMTRCGNGFVGLLPNRKGNRTPRAPAATLALADHIIEVDWETFRRKGRKTSWGKYCTECDLNGLAAISYVAFCARIKARKDHRQKAARVGEDAAYDLEPQYLELEYTTPRHGVRVWHIGHIDHTPIPLKFVHSRFKNLTSTVWLTLLIDAFSRKILAFYLTFDPPSYRSCMMVLRDCVRRHNRVPQIIVSDTGSDFMSTYYETQLAMLECTKRERKSRKPRGGSVIERIFKTSFVQFISNLLGSTDILEEHFRQISPNADPSRMAVWTLDAFDQGMERYKDFYHRQYHTGICATPDEVWARSLQAHGHRSHRKIPYTRDFIAQSCPAVHRGLAKITPRGIKVNYDWFRCDAFHRPGVMDTSVPGRYDPFNAGLAYAYVGGRWHECYSEHYAFLKRYSERAIRLATERLRCQDREAGRQFRLSAQRLVMFLSECEDQEIQLQQQKDEEGMSHRNKIKLFEPTNPAPKEGISLSHKKKKVSIQRLEKL